MQFPFRFGADSRNAPNLPPPPPPPKASAAKSQTRYNGTTRAHMRTGTHMLRVKLAHMHACVYMYIYPPSHPVSVNQRIGMSEI